MHSRVGFNLQSEIFNLQIEKLRQGGANFENLENFWDFEIQPYPSIGAASGKRNLAFVNALRSSSSTSDSSQLRAMASSLTRR